MFLETVKKFVILFTGVGVILLLYFLAVVVPEYSTYAILDGDYTIGFEFDEGVLTFIRAFLLGLEGIWLVFWAAFYFKVAKKATEEQPKTTYKKIVGFEKFYFFGVAAFLFFLVVASFVIPYAFYGENLAHFHAPDEPDAISVRVKGTDGFQWKFDIDMDGVYGDDIDNFFLKGQKYKFEVTAESFSHGLGIYSPDGVLRSQTNISPGITAILYHTFEFSGDYSFLCMEYCGIGHHGMLTTVTVGGN